VDSTLLATIVVAVDGPSGSGKSSVSRAVARWLGLRYLDTGAMYRAMGLWMLQHEVDIVDPVAVVASCHKPHLWSGTDPDRPTISIDGLDVSGAIRTPEASHAASSIAVVPEVRARLTALKRNIIGDGGIVVEGRDIGTVVAPDALVKVFLTASPEARAARRAAEAANITGAAIAQTHADILHRDRRDSSRATAPLAKAGDAVELDTTSLSLEQVVERVIGLIHERINQA